MYMFHIHLIFFHFMRDLLTTFVITDIGRTHLAIGLAFGVDNVLAKPIFTAVSIGIASVLWVGFRMFTRGVH